MTESDKSISGTVSWIFGLKSYHLNLSICAHVYLYYIYIYIYLCVCMVSIHGSDSFVVDPSSMAKPFQEPEM